MESVKCWLEYISTNPPLQTYIPYNVLFDELFRLYFTSMNINTMENIEVLSIIQAFDQYYDNVKVFSDECNRTIRNFILSNPTTDRNIIIDILSSVSIKFKFDDNPQFNNLVASVKSDISKLELNTLLDYYNMRLFTEPTSETLNTLVKILNTNNKSDNTTQNEYIMKYLIDKYVCDDVYKILLHHEKYEHIIYTYTMYMLNISFNKRDKYTFCHCFEKLYELSIHKFNPDLINYITKSIYD